jgi:hypothetical protein
MSVEAGYFRQINKVARIKSLPNCAYQSVPSAGRGTGTFMLTDYFRDPMALDRIQSTAGAPYLYIFADALTSLCNFEGGK